MWIEGNDVCVVVADGSAVRRAPLAGATPRVFRRSRRASSTSCRIRRSHRCPSRCRPDADPAHAPGSRAIVDGGDRRGPVGALTHTLLEVGLTLSPASYGGSGGRGPAHAARSVGLIGGVAELSDGIRDLASGTQLYDAAAEILVTWAPATPTSIWPRRRAERHAYGRRQRHRRLRRSALRARASPRPHSRSCADGPVRFRQGTDKTLAAMASIKIAVGRTQRVARLREGDPDATRDALRCSKPYVRTWLFRMLGGR